MPQLISDETITRYIKGCLKADELTSFNKHLSNNPDLQEEIEFQKELLEELIFLDNRRLKVKIKELDEREKLFYRTNRFVIIPILVIIGILILTKIVIAWNVQEPVASSKNTLEAVEFKCQLNYCLVRQSVLAVNTFIQPYGIPIVHYSIFDQSAKYQTNEEISDSVWRVKLRAGSDDDYFKTCEVF